MLGKELSFNKDKALLGMCMPSSNVAYCIPRNIVDTLTQGTAGLKKWGGGGLPVGGAGGGGGWGSWFSWNAAGLWRGGGVGAF